MASLEHLCQHGFQGFRGILKTPRVALGGVGDEQVRRDKNTEILTSPSPRLVGGEMELNCIQWRRATCVALGEHKAVVAIPDNRCHGRHVFCDAYL